jgi:hypothetical protein
MKLKITLTFLWVLTALFRVSGQSGYEPPHPASQTPSSPLLSPVLPCDPAYQMNEASCDAINLKAESYWQNFVKKDKKNADGWLNYYSAIRFRSNSLADAKLDTRLDSIENAMKKNVAGTWQQLYVHYWNGNNNVSRFASIEKANQLHPNHQGIIRQMIAYYTITGNLQKAGEFTAAWQKTNYLHQSYLDYANNVLQSVATGAVLFSNGEFDTYPVLYQQSKGIRSDVQVISISLLSNGKNRVSIFKRFGMILPDNDTMSTVDASFLKRIAASNSAKKIYIAATVGQGVLTLLKSNLYATGLAFRYSETSSIENLGFLKENVGTKMRLDNVGKVSGKTTTQEKMLELNYVLPLELAAQQYEAEGNKTKAKELRDKARSIGVMTGRQTEVNAIVKS